jgi:hypothetical protein
MSIYLLRCISPSVGGVCVESAASWPATTSWGTALLVRNQPGMVQSGLGQAVLPVRVASDGDEVGRQIHLRSAMLQGGNGEMGGGAR